MRGAGEEKKFERTLLVLYVSSLSFKKIYNEGFFFSFLFFSFLGSSQPSLGFAVATSIG